MLGKIIKHEFKATFRAYLLLFGAFLAVTLLTKMASYVPLDNPIWDIVSVILIIAWVLLLTFLTMAAVMIAVVRFYRTMVKDEGYLTHTIPVKKSQLIIGKYIVALIWSVLSVIMMVLSVLLICISTELMEGVVDVVNAAIRFMGESPEFIGHMLLVILMMVVSVSANILMCYASVSLGQMFSGHKVAGAVVFYFVLNYAVSILSSMAMFIVPGFVDRMNETENMTGTELLTNGFSVFDELMIIMTVLQVICFVVCYLITNWRFSKRLNLE